MAITELWPSDAPNQDADYDDRFTATPADVRSKSAERWMRDALELAPAPLRWFVSIGWRFVLGFRPSHENAILGWPIVEVTDDYVVMRQTSRLFDATLLLRRTDESLIWATQVRYRHRGARLLWAVVRIVHRRISPYFLRRAAERA